MNEKKKKALLAAGWSVGDAADFLGMNDEERKLLDLRTAVAQAVRRLREAHNLTQRQLAERMRSSQSRVAKVEAGSAGVSLDLSFEALFAAGGSLADVRTRPVKRLKRAGN